MSVSGLRGSHVLGVAGALALIVALAFWAPWSAETRGVAQVANVAINCEPGQQAVVRQIATGGEPQVSVQCVSGAAAGAAAMPQPAYVDQFGRPVPFVQPAAVGYTPAVYTVPQPVAAAPIARTTPVRRAASRVEPKRSWQKTALVIGGSAGAGAGIGALVGGKKGALIGAALGGGTAGIYEAVKR
jgi:hypothetical protein